MSVTGEAAATVMREALERLTPLFPLGTTVQISPTPPLMTIRISRAGGGSSYAAGSGVIGGTIFPWLSHRLRTVRGAA